MFFYEFHPRTIEIWLKTHFKPFISDKSIILFHQTTTIINFPLTNGRFPVSQRALITKNVVRKPDIIYLISKSQARLFSFSYELYIYTRKIRALRELRFICAHFSGKLYIHLVKWDEAASCRHIHRTRRLLVFVWLVSNIIGIIILVLVRRTFLGEFSLCFPIFAFFLTSSFKCT